MGRLTQVLGTTVCLSASGTGYAYWDREQRLATRREGLEAERLSLSKQVEATQEMMSQQERSHKMDVSALKQRSVTLNHFWTERNARYAEARKVNESHLTELPFTMQVMTGLKNHYVHLANSLPHFFSFDQGASKLHDFSILASILEQHVKSKKGDIIPPPPPLPPSAEVVSGENAPNNTTNKELEKTAGPEGKLVNFSHALYQMAHMFHAEPIVDTVCMNLRLNEMLRESPETLEQLSLTFELAEDNLRQSLKVVSAQRQKEATAAAEAKRLLEEAEHRRNENSRHSNLIHRAMRKMIGGLYLQESSGDEYDEIAAASSSFSGDTTSRSHGGGGPLSFLPLPWRKDSSRQEASEQQQHSSAQHTVGPLLGAGLPLLKTQGVYLHSSSDVAAAIKHVDVLLNAVDAQQLIQSLEEQDMVTQPVHALLSWQRAASHFLVQEQGTQVIKAFHMCLEYSFLNKDAGEPKDPKLLMD